MKAIAAPRARHDAAAIAVGVIGRQQGDTRRLSAVHVTACGNQAICAQGATHQHLAPIVPAQQRRGIQPFRERVPSRGQHQKSGACRAQRNHHRAGPGVGPSIRPGIRSDIGL
ncbi:hypothetical protein G6F68_020604 [Rhizopus microsporus]|nr:hypothetical protein G6F68_020604 [Rhizopus microsporus]